MVFVGVRSLETSIRYRQLLLPVELSSGTGGDDAPGGHQDQGRRRGGVGDLRRRRPARPVARFRAQPRRAMAVGFAKRRGGGP